MTKAERQWVDSSVRIGCIVCFERGFPETPGVVHHILKGGRRQSHKETLCLCDPGHHQYPPKGSGKIARHPTKARFEAAYGTEAHLLDRTRELVEVTA